MDDLQFLQVAKTIFDFRSTQDFSHPEFDNIQRLISNNEIESTFVNNRELIIDLSISDSNVIVDLVNYYIPNLNMKVIINNEEENLISKRINMSSHLFDITFELKDNILQLNQLPSGRLVINGDIDSISLLRAFESSSDIVLRSDIIINGLLRGNVNLFFEKLYVIVSDLIRENDDDSIFEMNLTVRGEISSEYNEIDFINKKNILIRCWEINHDEDYDKHIFKVKKL